MKEAVTAKSTGPSYSVSRPYEVNGERRQDFRVHTEKGRQQLKGLYQKYSPEVLGQVLDGIDTMPITSYEKDS